MYSGIKKEIMVSTYFGCGIGDIAENVILTPIWDLEGFAKNSDDILERFAGWYNGVTIAFGKRRITVINSRIGAPMSGDCALALGYTDCRNVIFSGSAGAVRNDYNIGDVLVAAEAVIGEGFSRYHGDDIEKDCFGEVVSGDKKIAERLLDEAAKRVSGHGAECRMGRVFSIDSILGERKDTFDYILEKGCDAVEMEASAVFTACRRTGKKAAMILISDLPLRSRNLFEGISDMEVKRYNEVKGDIPALLLEAAAGLPQGGRLYPDINGGAVYI